MFEAFLWLPWVRRRLLADAKLLGRWGEKRCEKFLKGKGYTTLAHNFNCRSGEIDLVMADGDGSIVFVEVKTRADESFGTAESAVTAVKQERMIKAAKYFISTHNITDKPLRFDVVTIVPDKDGSWQIRHYENAFRP